MAVRSADKKPEKYIGPDGKPRIRMVPVDKEVVKSEAKDGDGVNIVKDRPFKGKPMERKPGKVGIKFSDMRKSKWAKDADANPNRAKAMGEGYSPDLDPDVQKKKMITKSDKDKLAKLSDLMKKANEAKDPARTVSQLAIKDTNRRFDRAKKAAEKDDENSKYRTSKSGNVFVGLKKEAKDPEEYDKEGDMAKTQLKTMIDAAQELHDQLSDDENMPEWVQNKITKATDYIDSVRDYMKNNDDVNEETQLDEYGGPPISRAKYLKQKPMKERELTPGEMKKREKYAQDLPDAEFKKRYGDRWKSVKIATATKMAKGEK